MDSKTHVLIEFSKSMTLEDLLCLAKSFEVDLFYLFNQSFCSQYIVCTSGYYDKTNNKVNSDFYISSFQVFKHNASILSKYNLYFIDGTTLEEYISVLSIFNTSLPEFISNKKLQHKSLKEWKRLRPNLFKEHHEN